MNDQKIVTNPTTEYQRKAIQKIEESIEKISQDSHWHLPKDVGIEFRVTFDLSSVRAGGICHYDPFKQIITVQLHADALELYGDQYVNQTVVHEFSHAVQFVNYPHSKSHGREFKMFMRFFGVPTDRCHNYDLRQFKPTRKLRKPAKKFEYVCACQTHWIGAVRHKNIQKGSRFHCRTCRQPLVLKEVVGLDYNKDLVPAMA